MHVGGFYTLWKMCEVLHNPCRIYKLILIENVKVNSTMPIPLHVLYLDFFIIGN